MSKVSPAMREALDKAATHPVGRALVINRPKLRDALLRDGLIEADGFGNHSAGTGRFPLFKITEAGRAIAATSRLEPVTLDPPDRGLHWVCTNARVDPTHTRDEFGRASHRGRGGTLTIGEGEHAISVELHGDQIVIRGRHSGILVEPNADNMITVRSRS